MGEVELERFRNIVIPVNKSFGLTTYDVIRRFRKSIRVDKVGHSGTLDPQATGLVLLLTGSATKLSNYLMDLRKTYVADIMLGESTDTQDASGKVTRTGDWEGIKEEDILEVLPRFEGKRMQVPPMYSALKHGGKPLYTLARKGIEVERTPREVTAYSIVPIDFDLPRFRISVECSRGMYIRSLAEEIGEAAGVPAHLHALVRTRVGHFTLDSAVNDDDFEKLPEMEAPGYTMSEALKHLQPFNLTKQQWQGLKNGMPPVPNMDLPPEGDLLRLLTPEGTLGAIAEVNSAGLLKLRKVFAAL